MTGCVSVFSIGSLAVNECDVLYRATAEHREPRRAESAAQPHTADRHERTVQRASAARERRPRRQSQQQHSTRHGQPRPAHAAPPRRLHAVDADGDDVVVTESTADATAAAGSCSERQAAAGDARQGARRSADAAPQPHEHRRRVRAAAATARHQSAERRHLPAAPRRQQHHRPGSAQRHLPRCV